MCIHPGETVRMMTWLLDEWGLPPTKRGPTIIYTNSSGEDVHLSGHIKINGQEFMLVPERDY